MRRKGSAGNQPTSGCALHEAKGWLPAGRVTSTTWPGARSTGVVGPSSIPFERWTSTLTLLSVVPVVFSTVPLKALAVESYDRTSRAPARTSSKVSPRANWVPDSSPPSSDSEPLLCSPDSEPLLCSPDSDPLPPSSDSEPLLCSPDSDPLPPSSDSEPLLCSPDSDPLPPSSDSELLLCSPDSDLLPDSPDSEPLLCSPDSEPPLQPMRARTRTRQAPQGSSRDSGFFPLASPRWE